MPKQDKVFGLILIIAILGALYAIGQRFAAEQHNRAVELTVDFGEIRELASSTGQPVTEVLRRFRDAGAVSTAIEVETIGSLIDAGAVQLTLDRRGDLVLSTKNSKIRERLVRPLGPYAKTRRIIRADEHAPGFIGRQQDSPTAPPRGDAFFVDADPIFLRNLPVGLPEEAVQAVRSLGMGIVVRFASYPGIDRATIRRILKEAAADGAGTVIFSADQVAGFRGLIGETAQAMREYGLSYGSVEFGKQKGDAKLARLTEDRLIRVHSIPDAEMSQLDEGSAIERFLRAARERGIRLEYMHIFDGASDDPIAANIGFVAKVARGLASYGFGLRGARPLEDVSIPSWLLALMGLGVAAGAMLLVTSMLILPVRAKAIWTIIAAVAFCGLAASPGELGRKLAALASAFIFPTMAVVRAGADFGEGSAKGGWARAASARLVTAVFTTALGGVLIAGLLADRTFMLKIDQFAGIKVAHLVPLVLVFLLYASGIAWQQGTLDEQRRRAKETLRTFFAQPILVWQAAGLLVVLVVIGLLVARSGNEPGMGVSSIELKVRALLDRLLYVRPRTKEFLVGHPLLFLGAAFTAAGRRRWAAPLLVLGTIGQVSVLNTFCHIHTPIALSAARVLIGAAVGLVVGLILYLIVRRAGCLKAGEYT